MSAPKAGLNFMVVFRPFALSVLSVLSALSVLSGCANLLDPMLRASLKPPFVVRDRQHLRPRRGEHPSNRSAEDAIGQSLDNRPLARQPSENPRSHVAYIRDISRWPNDGMGHLHGDSNHDYLSFTGGLAPLTYPDCVPGEAFAAFLPGEYTPDDGMSGLSPAESFSGDMTYMDLFSNQAGGIVSDFRQFYSADGLAWLAGGLSAGALMANTGFDEHFLRDAYVESIVRAPNDELYEKLHEPKFLGDGYYTIPAFAIAALAEPLIDDLPLGSETAEWGQRSLRAILVGGPPMLGLQLLTGGSRPGETTANSRWKPFQDNNGVSGHSFMGAIPFISAAKMTNNLWLKSALYVASATPAVSRVNDDNHYFSQAFLGWWIAYIAANAVDRSHNPEANHHLFFYPQPDGVALGFEYLH